MTTPAFSRIADNVILGQGVRLVGWVNLYGCEIGDATFIGPFVEVQSGAVVGARVKLQSHSFVCSGVTIEDEVFIGHGVMFTNDKLPRATNPDGSPQGAQDWTMMPTRVGKRASIGSNATILCGVTIGEEAVIGAGSVVTRDVPPRAVVAGSPAKILRYLENPK